MESENLTKPNIFTHENLSKPYIRSRRAGKFTYSEFIKLFLENRANNAPLAIPAGHRATLAAKGIT